MFYGTLPVENPLKAIRCRRVPMTHAAPRYRPPGRYRGALLRPCRQRAADLSPGRASRVFHTHSTCIMAAAAAAAPEAVSSDALEFSVRLFEPVRSTLRCAAPPRCAARRRGRERGRPPSGPATRRRRSACRATHAPQDYYYAPPRAELGDPEHNRFRTGLDLVPVFRVFGATPGGQRTCLHVHGRAHDRLLRRRGSARAPPPSRSTQPHHLTPLAPPPPQADAVPLRAVA